MRAGCRRAWRWVDCERRARMRTRTPARALTQVAPHAPGRATARTHRVPLSPMVRGGRREVRGVSAQAGKSPAGRRSAGQPAPGSLLRLLRSLAAAAAPAPVPARQPCRTEPRPRPGAWSSAGTVRVCLCVRAPPSEPPEQGSQTRQGSQGVWGFTRVRVQLPARAYVCVCFCVCLCVVYVRAHAGVGIRARVCRCGYVCTPRARGD